MTNIFLADVARTDVLNRITASLQRHTARTGGNLLLR